MDILKNKVHYDGELIGSWEQHPDQTVSAHLHYSLNGRDVTVLIYENSFLGNDPNMEELLIYEYNQSRHLGKGATGRQGWTLHAKN